MDGDLTWGQSRTRPWTRHLEVVERISQTNHSFFDDFVFSALHYDSYNGDLSNDTLLD